MNTMKNLLKSFSLLERITKSSKKDQAHVSENELIHPRFEILKNDAVAQKRVSNSLLFLMYSQENEALFI